MAAQTGCRHSWKNGCKWEKPATYLTTTKNKAKSRCSISCDSLFALLFLWVSVLQVRCLTTWREVTAETLPPVIYSVVHFPGRKPAHIH
jgi:hypothetical protein